MARPITRFRDLSIPLKVAVVFAYILMVEFISWFFIGVVLGYHGI